MSTIPVEEAAFLPTVTNILSIISAIAVVYVLVMMVINLFISGRRSWIMSLLRVGITIAAAIIAIPVTRMISGLLTDVAYNLLLPMIPPSFESLLTDLPVGAEGLRVLASLVIAPILYLVVFLILRALLSIVGAIVCRLIPALRHPSLRAVSMPVGAVNGLLIAVVTLIPLCGFLAMGGEVLTAYATASATYQSTTLDDVLEDVADVTDHDIYRLGNYMSSHPMVTVVDETVGNTVFTQLTTGELDSTATHGKIVTMNLERELVGLVRIGVTAMTAADSMKKEDYTPADKQVLYDTADRAFESDWIFMLTTDAVVTMSQNWLDGKEFCGVARPTVSADVDPLITRTLLVLSTETAATMEEDLHTIMDVVGDILVADLLNSADMDPADIVVTLQESGLLTSTLAKLEANPRLNVLVDELKSLSIRLVTSMLGVEELKSGKYADEMDMVAGELTNVISLPKEERREIVHNALNTAFNDYGIEVPEDVAMQMSDKLIEELGQDGKIEGDELADYLVEHADEGFDLLPDEIPDDLPIDDLPVDDLPIDDLPVGDLPIDDLPVGDLPIDDLPVGDLPTDDIPEDLLP